MGGDERLDPLPLYRAHELPRGGGRPAVDEQPVHEVRARPVEGPARHRARHPEERDLAVRLGADHAAGSPAPGRSALACRHSARTAAARRRIEATTSGTRSRGSRSEAPATATTVVAVLAWATLPSVVSATRSTPWRDGRGTVPRSKGTDTATGPERGTSTSVPPDAALRPRGVRTRRRRRCARPSALSTVTGSRTRS